MTARAVVERRARSRARGARRTALGSSSPRPQPAVCRRHVGNRDQRQQRAARSGLIVPFSSLAMTKRPPGVDRSIDDSRLFDVVHVLVVLVAQAEVERQVVARLPVVLRVEVQPVGAAVLVAAADARDRRRRIAEQEVGERVAGELPGVGEGAARVVGLLGPELQVEVVAAELQAVRAAIERDVVVELEVLVVARGERPSDRPSCCRARRSRSAGSPTSRGSLVTPSRPTWLAKSLPRFRLDLPAVDRHPADAQLVQQRVAEDVRVAGRPGSASASSATGRIRARAFPAARWCRTAGARRRRTC